MICLSGMRVFSVPSALQRWRRYFAALHLPLLFPSLSDGLSICGKLGVSCWSATMDSLSMLSSRCGAAPLSLCYCWFVIFHLFVIRHSIEIIQFDFSSERKYV